MRLLRVPDGFVTDMITQGSRVLMTLRWHVRPPAPNDRIETASFGTWHVEELLSHPNEHRGAVVAVRVLPPERRAPASPSVPTPVSPSAPVPEHGAARP
ncbi:hypothetical protein [Deinococcus sp. LM3]|uniref:hypothetical protein n=1 Tax=Deinococcus sp. LM3 TaxID=1938608 RepID=UPI0009C4C889|nr:hypothetical protein [Deinococcus sp. LM3]OOV12819.1 hypothetical protein BXU09_15555 [Deinococcus sp. LM3]